MDDLDRLAFRLVRTVRNSYPHLIDQGFTLNDLEERLVPFREARREMADSGPNAWEITMLRLMAGERGYLMTEPALVRACQQALSLPSPSVSHVRSWSNSTVTLGHAAIHVGNERVQSGANDFDATAIGLAFASGGMPLTTPMTSTSSRSRMITGRTSNSNSAQRLSLHTHESGAVTVTSTPAPSAVADDSAEQDEPCRYCGGGLPDGRKLTFCPHCGVNLTVRQCPACSTELDIAWRFCVTCGRGADLPELPTSIARTPT